MAHLSYFLQDTFCVRELSEVSDIQSIFDQEKSHLDYCAFLKHSRILVVFRFIQLFQDTFGFLPSQTYVIDITRDTVDFKEVCLRFVNSSFLKLLVGQSQAPLMTLFSKAMETNQTRAITKQHIAKWLGRTDPGFGIEKETLLAFYGNHTLKHRVVGDIDTNYIDGIYLGETPIHINHYVCDVLNHHIILNLGIFRILYGKVMVFIHKDIREVDAMNISMAAGDYFNKERITIAASDATIQYIRENAKMNFNYLQNLIIPTNVAVLCIQVRLACHDKMSLGTTKIIDIVVNDSDKLVLGSLNAITGYNKDLVDQALPLPCIPLFAYSEIIKVYFKLYMDIVHTDLATKTPNLVGRSTIYSALSMHASQMQPTIEKCTYTILLIDTRQNPLSILALACTLHNVDVSMWNVTIITSKASIEYYSSVFPCANVISLPMLDMAPFDIDAYNDFLKSTVIWQTLVDLGFEKCLLVQDDGILCRKGLETSRFFTEYTYVGAPWVPSDLNKEVSELTRGNMVGNGGFCIRDIREMLDIAKKYKDTGNTLFNARLQLVQEDVFYSKYASKIPSLQEASLFSTEQIFNIDSFGFHKMWAYNELDKTVEFARRIILHGNMERSQPSIQGRA
jgi:hypothetical protein